MSLRNEKVESNEGEGSSEEKLYIQRKKLNLRDIK